MVARHKPSTCSNCPLYRIGKGFVRPELPADPSKVKLIITGEAPGTQEVDDGKPFVGKAGHWLRHNIISNAGVTADECWFDNVLRCLPPENKQGEAYPVGADKVAAERECRQYDRYDQFPATVPILAMGNHASELHTGHDTMSRWHGHITLANNRLVGITYHPSAVMRNPNLLPVAVKETSNLLLGASQRVRDVFDTPAILNRPKTWKAHHMPPGGAPRVIDYEWGSKDNVSAAEITVVGMAEGPDHATSTFDVAPAMEAIKAHHGTLIGHNIIDADIPMMKGWVPHDWKPSTVFDTKVVAHLIHAHLAELGLFDLGSMVRYYRPTMNWKDDTGDILEYNGRDCAYNYRLWEDLKADLDSTEQWHLVEKQQRLAHMSALMREAGIRVDGEAIRRFDKDWHIRRAELAAHFPFNPNSPPQTKQWLKDQGWSVKDSRYDTLYKLRGRHEIIDQLIAYKDEGKGIKTWFNEAAAESGIIHPTFNVTGTAVARFSCAEPNCQNIPPYLRHIIVAARDEELVSFDFSQIENRCIAYLADDEAMLADFATIDFHTLSASRILNKRVEDITSEERQIGKITIHATNYLETAYHLAERLYGNRTADSVRKARNLQDAYFSAYPAIRRWHNEVSRQLETGDVTLRNPFGRVRFVYAQDAHNRAKRACHFLGCSTAADVVNQRALDIWDRLGILPILIVHDELVFSIPKGEIGDRLKASIADILAEPVKEMGGITLPSKAKVGANYGTMA